MKKIAFIGVGKMGKPMVRNLVKLGFQVNIYARSIMKVYDVISSGARYHNTISDCLKECSVTITMLGFPRDIETIYFATGGLLDSAEKDSYVIDMTTTSPVLAKTLYNEGTKRGLHVLDAPVAGSELDAKNASLSIMVGGNEEDYRECLPIFRAMGKNINYMGSAGAGQNTKLASQIMVAGAISGVCEAMAYAKAKDIDMGKLMRAVSQSDAGSRQLELEVPKILDRDFTSGLSINYFIKDMMIAMDEAEKENLRLDVLETAARHYRKMDTDGSGNNGIQALIKYYSY